MTHQDKLEAELKDKLDEVYKIGLKNGAIDMKNKILKSLNQDWSLFRTKTELDLLFKVLKKINRMKYSPSSTIL